MAFRNGPIENVHAGEACPTCHGKQEYSHVTQSEMREIMKAAVDRMYTFLLLVDPKAYEALLKVGETYASSSDEPTVTSDI